VCAPCAELKAGDMRHIARSGWTDRPVDGAALVTLTAPGADVLGWDHSKCSHRPGVPCSGTLGCVVDADAAAIWHATLSRRWSDFMLYLRRCFPAVDVQYFKAYEWQKRGVLHVHFLVRLTGVVTQKRFRAAVRMLAHRFGFGRQIDVSWMTVDNMLSMVRATGYVAKYVCKGYDDLGAVRRLDVTTGEVTEACVRPWSASRSWGLTMRGAGLLRGSWASTAKRAAQAAAAVAPGAGGALDLYGDRSTLREAHGILPGSVNLGAV